MLPVRDEYIVFMLQIKIFSRRILVSTFSFRLL